MAAWHFELWISFKNVFGPILVILGVVGTALAFYLVDAESTISVSWLIPGVLFLLLLIFALYDLSVRAYGFTREAYPSVRYAVPYDGHELPILLLDRSSIYGMGLLVSVYEKIDPLEMLIAIGYVSNIQENGMIQVKIAFTTSDVDILRRASGDPGLLAKILVRPSGQFEVLFGGSAKNVN